MGCFDLTCAISGLPIQREQPVRWGLITPVDGYRNESPVYPCDQYAFWTPIFKGKYNDYGSVVNVSPSPLWNNLWKLIKVGLNHADDDKKPRLSGDKFEDLICQNILYYPDKGKKILPRKPIKMFLWMAHEFAFNYFKKNCEQKEIISWVKNFIQLKTSTNIPPWVGEEATEEEKIQYFKIHNDLEEGKGWIQGKQGSLDYFIDYFEFPEFKAIKDEYETLLCETVQFMHGMDPLRIIIRPNGVHGQRNDYKNETKWTTFLSKQCIKLKEKREREYR